MRGVPTSPIIIVFVMLLHPETGHYIPAITAYFLLVICFAVTVYVRRLLVTIRLLSPTMQIMTVSVKEGISPRVTEPVAFDHQEGMSARFLLPRIADLTTDLTAHG